MDDKKFNFTSGSLVRFGQLNIPRFAWDVKLAKSDSGTLGKVKFPQHPCKVTVFSFIAFSYHQREVKLLYVPRDVKYFTSLWRGNSKVVIYIKKR